MTKGTDMYFFRDKTKKWLFQVENISPNVTFEPGDKSSPVLKTVAVVCVSNL